MYREISDSVSMAVAAGAAAEPAAVDDDDEEEDEDDDGDGEAESCAGGAVAASPRRFWMSSSPSSRNALACSKYLRAPA
jgi:hypothetical protein